MKVIMQDPMGIDPALIPRADVQNLAFTFLTAVKKFYDNPENERRFQEWMQQHQKTKEAKNDRAHN